MKIGIVYPFVSASSFRPEVDYVAGAKRFADTLKEFTSVYDFQLWVINTGGVGSPEIFKDIPTMWDEYLGEGLDVGVWMHAAKHLIDYDMLIFSNSLAYFNQKGWLERLVDSRTRYGDGLYGFSGSYERAYHIRTTIFACNPKTLLLYPDKILTRPDTLDFESGQPNRLTRFFEKRNEPVLWVAKDGTYDKTEWYAVKNGFRSGDQSNLLIRDRHIDYYDAAPEEEKAELTARAWPPYS